VPPSPPFQASEQAQSDMLSLYNLIRKSQSIVPLSAQPVPSMFNSKSEEPIPENVENVVIFDFKSNLTTRIPQLQSLALPPAAPVKVERLSIGGPVVELVFVSTLATVFWASSSLIASSLMQATLFETVTGVSNGGVWLLDYVMAISMSFTVCLCLIAFGYEWVKETFSF